MFKSKDHIQANIKNFLQEKKKYAKSWMYKMKQERWTFEYYWKILYEFIWKEQKNNHISDKRTLTSF